MGVVWYRVLETLLVDITSTHKIVTFVYIFLLSWIRGLPLLCLPDGGLVG